MDVILHYADELVLDAVWGAITPATPTSSILRRSPRMLKHFLSDSQTKAALRQSSSASAQAFASAAAASYKYNETGSGSLLSGWTSTIVRAASGAIASGSASAAASGKVAQKALDSSAAWAEASMDWDAISGLSALTRDNWIRQAISLYTITYVGILVLYFLFAGLSYKFFFNKDMLRHPRFLKNQVKLEIQSSLRAFPVLDMLTLPWFLGEVRGWSKLYTKAEQGPGATAWWGLGGWTYIIFSVIFFLVFTDFCIYWVHRLEHHPRLYKHVHKPHHKWLIPTPFASHAFHPVDGYAQSLPYHVFVYLFPLHRMVYMGLFVFVNFWSILIHDSDMICNSPLEKIINGPSHHTLHHLYFNVNYGQYFTGCDRMGGSYRAPKMEDDPLHDIVKADAKQTKKVQ